MKNYFSNKEWDRSINTDTKYSSLYIVKKAN